MLCMIKRLFRPAYSIKPVCLILVWLFVFCATPVSGQKKGSSKPKVDKLSPKRVVYGLASFYHDKFNGRPTASGEIFSQLKLTCASNIFPMGTWIKVTNLQNDKSVVVRVNDRLHARISHIIDLSRTAAKKMGHSGLGLLKIKVEVLGKKKPAWLKKAA